MSRLIEEKEDSIEKLNAVAGKPTKNYLFATEFNAIVSQLETLGIKDETITNQITMINTLLSSDDANFDTLQEIVNKLKNAIPLTGTTEGNPVTGDIEFLEGAVLYNNAGESDNNLFINDDSIGFVVTKKTTDEASLISLNTGVISVSSSNPDFLGIVSNADYSNINPENKQIYAQRSYVDTQFNNSIPLTGTTEGNPVTGNIMMTLIGDGYNYGELAINRDTDTIAIIKTDNGSKYDIDVNQSFIGTIAGGFLWRQDGETRIINITDTGLSDNHTKNPSLDSDYTQKHYVDSKVNAAIQLTGTTEDNPVTGGIEFLEGSKNLWVKGGDYPNNYFSLSFAEGGISFNYMDTVNPQNIRNVSFGGSVGLIGSNDFSSSHPQNKRIYAQRAYVDKANSYSTDETLTGGTWIDGKPIYRKVFTGSLVNGNFITNVPDVENVINLHGVFSDMDDFNQYVLPFVRLGYTGSVISGSTFGELNYSKDGGDILCSVSFNGQQIDGSVKIIFEYTKTTD